MTHTMKSVLLSAAIFPGAGHFYLKKYITAVLLASVASITSLLIIANFTSRILMVFEKIKAGELAPDFLLIMQQILKQPVDPDARLSIVVWIVLIICWLVAIVDSYRIAKL